ncbi:hypothetical protein CPB84DRAFT_1790359 [Gymnopilus junonius]|uniref:DUF202 domain-containing protein n=1 Tax=Gymnopilus junonius TaxID=109634 RepID=A0A9P5TJM6_GYMJU|nr:hypothetical protein CPB84DRAFT_1790359 [Gymnopilus junonius]
MSSSPAYLDNNGADIPNETSSLLNGQSSRRPVAYHHSASASPHVSIHTPLASPHSLSGSRFHIRRTKSSSTDGTKRARFSKVELRLKNVGSVARDHLSSERTFLSYVRTSLALSSAGIALMQFLYLGSTTKSAAGPLGAVLIVFALLVLYMGTKRYFLVQRTLITGYFPVSTIGIAVISFCLGSLVTITFCVTLMGRSK